MQQAGVSKSFPLALAVAVLFGAVVVLTSMAAFSMVWGNWGMGGWGMNNHMQRMMGGGTNSSDSPLSVGTKAERIEIRDFAYAPGNLQVPVGAAVTWTNYDDAPHTATAKDGSWDTGILGKSEMKTITFEQVGEYLYYCTVHPSMVARVKVQ
ncbi:MAG: cupredoxin family copper-binding protein [Chloroflexi bacterium]|nr:cupredoxin family copper-binding protein [Chloroflexota bacterium]